MAYATVLVNVLDREGYETGRAVPVSLEYVRLVENQYGADADGHRGTLLVEYDVTNQWTDAVLLKEEEDQVLRDGVKAFLNDPEQYAARANRRVLTY